MNAYWKGIVLGLVVLSAGDGSGKTGCVGFEILH